MTTLDGAALLGRLPPVRGALTPMRPLAELTWLRVGGPAEVLFRPADADDLATFLAATPADVAVTPLGLGSNLIVRDGGVPGVVVRLGRAFAAIERAGPVRLKVGAAAPDGRVAAAAAAAGIAGLEFLRTIPGSIGGALRMNAGCYGDYMADRFVRAEAIDRRGRRVTLDAAAMGFGYRASAAPDDLIFVAAELEGAPGEPAAIAARMAELVRRRAETQPVKERSAGSTFRNPAGFSSTGRPDDDHALKAWRLIDEAGCRGLSLGGARMSPMHPNFLVNAGGATAADLENLGEEVRRKVFSTSGVQLEWEIKRIGVNPGR